MAFSPDSLRGREGSSRGWRWLVWPWVAAAAWLLAATGGALAQDEAARQRLEALDAATVGIEVRALDSAPSALTVGREREGTGMVIDAQGTVLTIAYLLLEAESVQLVTRDDKRIPARVVAYDAVTGLGLLRPVVPLPGATPVRLGTALGLPKGSPLLFISGADPRQAGAVRLVDRRPFTGYWEYHLDAALYTAPLVANHSGAGLFNAAGELVGVGHLAMRDVMPADDPRALPGNMFVPVDVLVPLIEELLRTGTHAGARRPWMGVNAVEVDGQVRITRVMRGSPAETAGVRPGHRILAVDGASVGSLQAFYQRVWAHPMGQGTIRLSVGEGERTRSLEMPVRDRSELVERPRGI